MTNQFNIGSDEPTDLSPEDQARKDWAMNMTVYDSKTRKFIEDEVLRTLHETRMEFDLGPVRFPTGCDEQRAQYYEQAQKWLQPETPKTVEEVVTAPEATSKAKPARKKKNSVKFLSDAELHAAGKMAFATYNKSYIHGKNFSNCLRHLQNPGTEHPEGILPLVMASKLTPAAKQLMSFLLNLAGRQGQFVLNPNTGSKVYVPDLRVTREECAARCGLTVRSMTRAMKQLVGVGLIRGRRKPDTLVSRSGREHEEQPGWDLALCNVTPEILVAMGVNFGTLPIKVIIACVKQSIANTEWVMDRYRFPALNKAGKEQVLNAMKTEFRRVRASKNGTVSAEAAATLKAMQELV